MKSVLTFLLDDGNVDGVERLASATAYIEHVTAQLTRQPGEWCRHQREGGARLHRRVADTADS